MTINAIKTSVAIDKELLDKARKLKINISRACVDGLRAEVNEYEKYLKFKEKREQKAQKAIK